MSLLRKPVVSFYMLAFVILLLIPQLALDETNLRRR